MWGERPLNLKFGDISGLCFQVISLSNSFLIIFFFPLFAFITDSPTNKRLLSGRFVTLIQGRNLWTALSTSPAAYSCLSLHSRKTGSRRGRSGNRDGGEREGQTALWMKQRGGETGRGGNHSIVSAQGKRYEYSNFTLLIRDGSLFLWGKALLVFVSSLIICMMYSTALYSVMGERWRSGRLTMRPKGRRGRHSQLYSMQSSKATLLYPKLVTISQSLKPTSNNSTDLHSS